MTSERNLRKEFLQGGISRRQFVMRSLALGVSLSSVGAFLSACGQATPAGPVSQATAKPTEKPPEAQQLVIGASKDIRSLDPVQHNDADSQYVYDLIHDTVALLDSDFNVTPHLAESWDVSDDGLEYTYHFRKGVKFHDGSELTADDVVFTIERILRNEYPEGRKKEKIEMIDSYQKVDDSTVEIKLKFAYAPFAAGFGVQAIVPKAAVERMGDVEYGKAPVGCGPFKYVEWKPNTHVVLEGFDDYWMVKPKLDGITVRPIPENAVAVANLIAGDVDVINDVVSTNIPQLQGAADKGIEVLNAAGFSYYFLGFRMMKPPFTDLRFRQAVYMSTDWDGAIETILPPELGRRAYGTVPPGLWPRDEEYLKSIALKQDKEKAKALIQELMDEGVMDEETKVTIIPPQDDTRIRLGEILATNLQELGVNAELLIIEWATFPEYRSGPENIIYMLGTVPAIPDPDANVRWLFSKDSVHGTSLNIVHFAEYPEWDALIKKAQMSQDRGEREQIYRDLVRTMMELRVHIPLYHRNAIMAMRDYVKDFRPSPLYRWDIVRPWAHVHIEGKES